MITETGKVVALAGDQVWVQTIRTSACQSCSARSGCGQRALAAVSGGRANQVLVDNSVGARVGDEVVIGLDEQSLLNASLIIYGLPLVLMVLASVMAHTWAAGSDLGAIAGAVAGLGVGFWLVQRWQAGAGDRYQPRLLRIKTIPSSTCP
ncbi:SoxR reducing system RseC family protein [Marinobacter nauticus]|uniref:SoxR reducing system RseC family protein n=1 Tax=Marinobacter nauticus TaxID=2743 RepID=UPI001C96DEF8|nr:SoxR reducing system RseC family protein [Marinobacter nauticus]MBY5963163.1 SoxR reducing system RseC family protein [Marinobacter nauticus]MBY6103573.1 SoxR reducing system RseC family protein [Marinobacter nauticus]